MPRRRPAGATAAAAAASVAGRGGARQDRRQCCSVPGARQERRQLRQQRVAGRGGARQDCRQCCSVPRRRPAGATAVAAAASSGLRRRGGRTGRRRRRCESGCLDGDGGPVGGAVAEPEQAKVTARRAMCGADALRRASRPRASPAEVGLWCLAMMFLSAHLLASMNSLSKQSIYIYI